MRLDVSDVKTVRWTVFTIGVTQSKEYGAGGCAARHGRLCDGDRDEGERDRRSGFDATPAAYRGRCYPPFHARRRTKEDDTGGREMRVSTPPARKLGGFDRNGRLRQRQGRALFRCAPLLLAERVGFEPTWACAQTDFESAPL